MDIVLFGIQGSGKGTQGKLLAEKFNLTIFETGGQLRKLSQEDSELGRKVKETIEAGHLVTNEIVMEIIENFIDTLPEGQAVLFDGIPRKPVQAETFNALMEKKEREFKGFLINISKEEALRRLTTRRICVDCKATFPSFYDKEKCESCGGELITRKDDNPTSIENRLNAYEQETLPVIKAYQEEGKLIDVNGEQSIEAVTTELLEKFKNL